ncbi:MAG: hypothetical protein OXU61_14060, partial [Gammaproteobacteria bacterium]|nr:hypothetical protein [Gammaproteobacteria bacterium]
MIVALFVLQVTQRLGARTTRLVDGDERPGRQVFPLNQPLQQARNLVGAAAGAGHDNQFNRLLRR